MNGPAAFLPMSRAASVLIVLLTILAGCSRQTPSPGITPIKAANPAELQKDLLSHKPELDLFRLRGPFRVTPLQDVAVTAGSSMPGGSDRR